MSQFVCSEPGNSGLPLEGPLGPKLKRLLTRVVCNRKQCQKWENRLSIREQDRVVESWWKIEKLKIQTERAGIGPALVRPHRVCVGMYGDVVRAKADSGLILIILLFCVFSVGSLLFWWWGKSSKRELRRLQLPSPSGWTFTLSEWMGFVAQTQTQTRRKL